MYSTLFVYVSSRNELMEREPHGQMPIDQPQSKSAGSYLDELSSRAEKYFARFPQEAETLEAKIELTASAIGNYLADKPYLQQKLAVLLDYNPNRWLLAQEIPEVLARRKIHRRPHCDNDQRADDLNARDVYAWARNSVLQGICFSGGGIRSATLNLGVLQGLAKFGFLDHFDYLSSVSGGGYIHEWFAAWIKREEQQQKQAADQALPRQNYVPGSGFREVEKRLVPLPSSSTYPIQPDTIRWLRRYSNYLTPQKGLFTGDTWVAVAIWLRNTFLNQLILVSGLFFLLLLPWLIGSVIFRVPSFCSIVVSVALFLVAVLAIAFELQREYRRIKFMDDHKTDHQKPEAPLRWGGERTIQALIVVPLLLACVLYLPVVISLPGIDFRDPTAQDVGVFALLWLLVASAATAGCSVKAYMALHGINVNKPSSDGCQQVPDGVWTNAVQAIRIAVNGFGGLVITNAALSALAGTLFFEGVRWILRYDLARLIPSSVLSSSDAYRFQLAFGPPLLFAVPFFAIVIGAGLVGRDFPDWLREWLARVRAWALLFGLGWALFFGIALLGPSLLHWLPIKLSATIAWLATTAGSVLAGKSNKTSGKSVEGASRSSVPLDMLAKVGAYVFILGLLLVLSVAVKLSLENVSRHINSGPAWVVWILHVLHLHPAPIWLLLIFALAIFGLFGWRVDVNDFSLNPFYRNRLTRCYLGASNRHRAPNPLTGFDDRDTRGMQISRLIPGQGYTGPFPIVCATINLSFGEDLAWQERKAASFAFTPVCSGYYVGWTAGKPGKTLNCCGFVPTFTYAFPDGGINMATAVAISGAAASPNWGYHTDPATAFLMTIFNVRLGWWLFNPKRPETDTWASPRFAPLELTKELLGM